ncbi:MAG TPA: choice-of-anchor Q domain-containing protein [Gemmataceae bacterium]|nr:choice-of-anchor Q domain-containing protein [Gemmataceae bacterium]
MPKTHKPFRRSALRLTNLEDRLAPASFNIAAGDIAALRAAIITSNNNNQPDVINLAAGGVYTFSDVADPIDGGNALPTIQTDTNNIVNTLTINGNGANLVRSGVAGTPFFRFVRENLSAALQPPPTLTINNVTFVNGRIDPSTTQLGGAVLLAGGNMTLTDCTFSGNQAPNGGAIGANQVTTSPRPLTITRGIFTQNAATAGNGAGAGGAIYNVSSSVLGITDSTFTGNTSAAEGGAIRVQTSSTVTTISGSTFTTNTANGGNGGGAVFIQGTTFIADTTMTGNISAVGGGGLWNQGTLTVSGSNISNNLANSSTASGGGIFVQGDFTLTNSTIVGNRAGSGGGVAYALGGNQAAITSSTITDNRVYFPLASGGGLQIGGQNLQLGNSVIASNVFEATVSSGTGPDVSGTVASLGYNLIGNGSGATITGVTTGNMIGTTGAPIDPKLAPLANNGGRTQTRLPLASSPLINAGDPSFASPPGPTTDERGSGYARVQFGRIDIGATEAQGARVASVVTNGGATQRSRVTDLTINFNSVVTLPANPASAFSLVNTTVGPNAVVTLSVDLSGSTPTQTVAKLSWAGTGPVTEFGSLIDGNYTLTILGSQITGEGGMQLDGNGDGTPGGDNVSTFYRLYGDVDGNKTVNGTDLGTFRTAFGTTSADAGYVAALDWNNDGVINGTDLGQFRSRFGVILP